ncbi:MULTISPECIES: hydroxymethylbilane synthase [unclassified Actinobaculum]|uniref:hydroxymethylbilane synthase n=1 Tax=unclassified Actinobaculum TaxID=2609299 RepID=UPI000F7ECFD3|nr:MULTISPECIES: hydroxymethylbilane synthase [unclassified Actinobaculum]RTE50357.1 hydroxymethylbilane synthase [Actinobaculum sp. 352]
MRLGTRASALAMTQSTLVADRLRETGPDVELVPVRTCGDRERGSLKHLAGLGVFAAELRSALLRGDVDFAVHSLKDLPTETVPGLVIAAIPQREVAADAMCARDGMRLIDLPAGARVGTGSPRRVAQLRALRPDLVFVDIRGNIGTRLERVRPGDLDAVVLAAAGLRRLGLAGYITEELPILPAPGQGALAVECRSDDEKTASILRTLDDPDSRLQAQEEREVLAVLGGGCAAPIAALGIDGLLRAAVFAADGSRHVAVTVPLHSGAGRIAAQCLLDDGAAAIADLGASRQSRLEEFHDDVALWREGKAREEGRPHSLREGADTFPSREGAVAPPPGEEPGASSSHEEAWAPFAWRKAEVFLPREEGVLSAALRELGIVVTACPVQRRRLLTPNIPSDQLEQAQWSVITSARTVGALKELGVQLPGRIAAVGHATARALEAAGYGVDLIPREESAAGLLAEFPRGGGHVFLPCSALAGPELADGLRGRGWQVDVQSVYTMEEVEISAAIRRRWQGGEFAVVVITSGSVARTVDRVLGWPRATAVVALGPATARVLDELGVAAEISPTPHAPDVAATVAQLVVKAGEAAL